MATNAGEISVTLTLNADDFSKALAKTQKSVETANDSMLASVKNFATGIAAAFTATKVVGFLNDSLNAFGQNQVAIAGLTRALQNHGIASQGLINNLTETATRLQTLTGVSDESIISAQTLLTTFGLQGEVLNKSVNAALDLAATRHIDLESAALLLGKAFAGETGMLSRYGIEVNKTLDPQRKFAQVLDQVNTQMGGQAIAQAKTYTGQVKILKETFNDLEEEIGRMLSGNAGKLVKWLTSTTLTLTSFTKEVNNTSSGWKTVGLVIGNIVIGAFTMFESIVVRLIGLVAEGLTKIPMLGSAFVGFSTTMKSLNADIDTQAKLLRAALAASLENKNQQVGDQKDIQEAVTDTTAGIVGAAEDRNIAVQDKLKEEVAIRSKQAAELKDAQIDFAKSFLDTEAKMWDFATQMSNTFFEGVGDSLAATIIEGKSFGAAMRNVFKQMAEAIISYVVQIIAKMLVLLALETATGTGAAGGKLLGGFSGFAAEGGVIGEPSLVTGLRSGRSMIAGEAGPEYIVPSKNMTAGKAGISFGGEGGGSGSVVINISGQFLEADENAWGRLMREKILPEIRRSTMISPTGNFNRRRGVA